MRHDDDHLNTTLRRTDQCSKHLIIQDQIRGHDMHIFFCMVQNMEIYFFSYIFMIKRAVCIWNHISQFFIQCILFLGQIFSIRLHAAHIHIPHLQEYHRQALDSITSQQYRRILPVSEPFLLIDILISKIHASYISHLSIDHADLSVITVVLDR